MSYSARIERLYPREPAVPIETVQQAHAFVAAWQGAKPGKSPASWRRDAAGRIANAGLDESRGRTAAAAVEREIAQVFEDAALAREGEIAAADAAYDARKAADVEASDQMMRDLAAKHARK